MRRVRSRGAGKVRWKTASATRSSCQLNTSPSNRTNRIERCQRLPGTSLTYIDADVSWRITRSTPAVRSKETLGIRPRDGDDCARRRKDHTQPRAQATKELKPSADRQFLTTPEATRVGAAGANCHPQSARSPIGTRRSQISSGASNRTLLKSMEGNTARHPLRSGRLFSPALSGSASRSSGRIGASALNFFISVPDGGAPG